MRLNFNVPFACPDNIFSSLQKVFAGEYDIPMLVNGATIIDLGANCGDFSIWAAHRFPHSRVLSYEPNPEPFQYLTENIKLYPMIEAFNHGIGNPGLRPYQEGVNNSGEGTFYAQMDKKEDGKRLTLEVRDPSTLPQCNILKLDIEGCEMEVLGPLFERGDRPEVILLEWHNHILREQIEDLLRPDYYLIGGAIEDMRGRGVFKWLRRDLLVGPR